MATGKDWRYAVGGNQHGPLSLDELRSLVSSGQLPIDAVVWRSGMSDWVPWQQVPELASAVPSGAGAYAPPHYVGAPPGSSPFVDFLVFRRMIVPLIIQVIFWLGIGACLVIGIVGLAQGAIEALLVLVLGPLVVRIYCELLIIFFRMNETLTDIKNELVRQRR